MNGKIITEKDGKVIIEEASKELNNLIEKSLEKMDNEPIFIGFDEDCCESYGSDIPESYEQFKSIIDKNPSLGLSYQDNKPDKIALPPKELLETGLKGQRLHGIIIDERTNLDDK